MLITIVVGAKIECRVGGTHLFERVGTTTHPYGRGRTEFVFELWKDELLAWGT